jgi:hypothetical protein
MATVGTGTTITFDTGFFAEILSVNWSGITRPSIDTSHMGTATAMTYTPGSLFDPGELQVEIAFVPGTAPPWDSVAETCTVTWPDAGTATWAASGFMTEFEVSGALEERLTATGTVKLSGDITIVP